MKYKNSAVDLTDLALGIVVLGIVVSIGANILINMQANKLTDLTVLTATNETVTAPEVSTASQLSKVWGIEVSSCFNASTETQIEAANFTSSVDSFGHISVTPAATAEEWLGGDWTCTYTYYDTGSRADYNLTGDAATGLAEYGNWFDIIVIVGVAALILTIIFMAFGGSRGSTGSVNF